jgi:hypothetical protein
MNFLSPDTSRPESGNVLMTILLWISLLACIGLIVGWLMTDRGESLGAGISREKARQYSTALIKSGLDVLNGVTQLKIRGVQSGDYSFAYPDLPPVYGQFGTDPPHEIFNPAGGRAKFQKFTANAMEDPSKGDGVFSFVSGNAVEGVGESCANSDCSELLMVLDGIKVEVCADINDLLEISSLNDETPVDQGFDPESVYQNDFSYTGTIGDEPTSEGLAGKRAGCFKDQASKSYVFYQVLLAR